MLAKTSNKKQLAVPKSVAEATRAKLAKLELNEKDIAGAVAWARRRASRAKK